MLFQWSLIAFAVLVFPGLLFGAGMAMAGEWVFAALRPLLTRRMYRFQGGLRPFFQPLYDFLKLAGRQSSRNYIFTMLPYSGADQVGEASPVHRWPALLCAVAPIMTLALLPFPGSLIAGQTGSIADLFMVLSLLAVQPVCRALLRLNTEGLSVSARGAQDLGRLSTGLFPVLVAVAALVEMGGERSLLIGDITSAPQTATEAVVRLLSGFALLLALPWWLDAKGVEMGESAGSYAGKLLQRVALAAFWAVLVLPMPRELPSAVATVVGGTFCSYIIMRILIERAIPTLKERDAARLMWISALPMAAISLVAAFLSGA